jgi:hypothetical protein
LPRSAVALPERSDAGEWDGTWFYLNRSMRMVLWLETENGTPRLKIEYASDAPNERFTTDWDGEAAYIAAEHHGRFSLRITEADADTIRGAWSWILDFGERSRQEAADVTLYRTGDGRRLVMQFDGHERVLISPSGVSPLLSETAWTFRKVSKRLALSDELPF